jgi:hypothetical protein
VRLLYPLPASTILRPLYFGGILSGSEKFLYLGFSSFGIVSSFNFLIQDKLTRAIKFETFLGVHSEFPSIEEMFLEAF